MNLKQKLIGAAVCLWIPYTAFALDQSPMVNVTQVLKATKSWDGRPITYPQGEAEVTGLLVEVAPGGETGWHLHPVPSFAMVLAGTLEVALKDGRVKRLQTGDALAEVVDTLHNGRNVGNVPVRLIVFYAGTSGQSLSVKQNEMKAATP